MVRLPDDSGLCVGHIGPRERGLLNMLKYRPHGGSRAWLFVYHMTRDAYCLSRVIGGGSPLSWWQSFTYAWSVRHDA